MSDCSGYQHNFPQPKSAVFQPEYPAPLKGDGGVSYDSGLQNWACKQAVIGNQVVDDFEFAFFYAVIQNPDPTERRAAHLLPLTMYSNSPAFIEAAGRHGMNVTLVPNFGPASRTPLGLDREYTTFVFPSDSKDFTFRGLVSHVPGIDWSATLGFYFLAEGKIRRAFYEEHAEMSNGNDGIMEFGPESYWAKHSRAVHDKDGINYFTGGTVHFGFDNVWSMNSTTPL